MAGRAVRFGWIVMLILGIYWLGFGVYKIVDPGVLLESGFEEIAGQSWAAFVAANPAATVELIEMLVINMAIAQVAIAAFVLMLTLFGYRRGQKWAWYSLLVGNIIILVGILISSILSSLDFRMPIIGLVLLIIALAVPAKSILTQQSS